jgi:hypothetical protein
MMVVEAETSFICWCWCHGKWLVAKRAVSCSECVELCLKEGAKRIEYYCVKESPPPEVEVEFE